MKTLISCALVITLTAGPTAVASAADPAEPAAPVRLKNVELTEDGTLQGQYVSHAGLPVSGAELTIQIGKEKHQLTADATGRFELKGLRGGRCLVIAGKEVFACQLWAHGTAPPGAISSIAVVASKTSDVRGNAFLPRPFVPGASKLSALSATQVLGIGAVIAGTTVAISVAASKDDASH